MQGRRITGIAGAPPDLAHLPAGCAFRERCTRALAECAQSVPLLRATAGGQSAACFLPGVAAQMPVTHSTATSI
jgi:oligopeptide/dipeptide ABC transporter ATP-binding protein